MFCELCCEIDREPYFRRFCRARAAGARGEVSSQGSTSRNVDDHTVARFLQQTKGTLGQPKLREKIHRHALHQVFFRDFRKGLVDSRARVVDENVQSPVVLIQVSDQAVNIGQASDISLDGIDGHPRCTLHVFYSLGQALLPTSADNDLSPFLRKSSGRCQANTSASSCDTHHLFYKLQLHFISLLVSSSDCKQSEVLIHCVGASGLKTGTERVSSCDGTKVTSTRMPIDKPSRSQSTRFVNRVGPSSRVT